LENTTEGNLARQNDEKRVEVLAFTQDGYLERHVDHVRGVVLVISIGATARFFCNSKSSATGRDLELSARSGDAVAFNSSGAANIEHGISGLDSDKPDWFQFRDSNFVRICIQYRESGE
jgi:hypothetical protein